MKLLQSVIAFILCCLFSNDSFAEGGIKGSIKNVKGESLSFASIIIKGQNKGTMANEDGLYELSLPSGTYTVVFQYLSHKSLEKTVNVQNDYVTLNVSLEEQSISLNEVKFSAKTEDPAYTIMRKAISMARFHILEVSNYNARTYVKGTGKVNSVSKLLKAVAGNKMEKELGLKIGQTYILESINDINFSQPNTVKEKIVSSRSNFPKQIQSSSGNIITFARTNFYVSNVGGVVSPLSPSALAYYKFSFEGMFEDRGVQVNKIKVTPKSWGPDVFSGTINIIEDSWAIHSLDLKFNDENGNYTLKQLYAPFKDVWMPVYMDSGFNFDAFGIVAEGRYVTNVRNYNVTINPKYHQQPVVIDEKIDKAEAKELKGQKVDKNLALKQQSMTRKQLKKVLKDLEKEDKAEKKAQNQNVDVVRDYSLDVDSLSTKRNNDFWNTERQVPLTEYEVIGYKQADSLNKVNEGQIKKDSLKNLPKFKLSHIFAGHTYNYGPRTPLYGYQKSLIYSSPLMPNSNVDGFYYNTVEGFYLESGLKYIKRNKLLSRMEIGTDLRYSFGREKLTGLLYGTYVHNYTQISVKGGQFVYQYNQNQPITSLVNTFYTLLFEQNYMKLYEKTFAQIDFRHQFSPKITGTIGLETAERHILENAANAKPIFDNKNREFSSNLPVSSELANVSWSNHSIQFLNAGLTIRPFAKTSKFNGREFISNYRNPNFRIRSKWGFSKAGDFNNTEIEYEQVFNLNRLGDLRLMVTAGDFLKKPSYFLDYKHFNGNQVLFRREGLFNSFRNLDYYNYSTNGSYIEAHAQQDFRSLLLTKINLLRLYGLKESVFANYLYTGNKNFNYLEVGYGVSGIGKIFGLEVVSNFINGKYDATALRVKFSR